MPAYWHPGKYLCEQRGCGKRSDGQVMNDRNAPIGWYCEPHGLRVVEEMNTRLAVWDPASPERLPNTC